MAIIFVVNKEVTTAVIMQAMIICSILIPFYCFTDSSVISLNSNLANHNIEYHARMYPTTGWISGIVNEKIAQGYKGGDIQLVGYAPPDSYMGDAFGIIKWVLVFNDIAHLQFIKARENIIVTRALSTTEGLDTGWVVH